MANDYPFIMLPVAIFQEDLSGADFKVFGALAMHTNKDRVCRVFVRTICEKTGISRRSVFNSLTKLEQLGYIKRQNEINKGFGANYYYIDFNPAPSAENCTSLVQNNSLPSAENCTYKELNLKELYLNSKNLKRASAKKSKEVLEKPEIQNTDREIVEYIAENWQDVYLWAQVIKTNAGLSIRPISKIGEKNINNRLPDLVANIEYEFGTKLAILPASANVLNSVEVA